MKRKNINNDGLMTNEYNKLSNITTFYVIGNYFKNW